MLFNFAIETEHGGATFGICTADDIDAAKKFISEQSGCDPLCIAVEHGAEALIDQQYGGLAYLTNEGDL